MFPSRVMVLKLSKKVHFSKFYADLSKSFEEIYIYASKRSRNALRKMVLFIMLTYFGDIRV